MFSCFVNPSVFYLCLCSFQIRIFTILCGVCIKNFLYHGTICVDQIAPHILNSKPIRAKYCQTVKLSTHIERKKEMLTSLA